MSKLETTKVRGCGSGSGSVPGKCGNAADEWHDAIRMFWWNMDAGNCSAYGVYLFRLFICSFKTRAFIQFLYTVQLCMQYVVSSLVIWWPHGAIHPWLKHTTPSDALPLQSGFQLKRHFSHLPAWAWDLNCMSTDNGELTLPGLLRAEWSLHDDTVQSDAVWWHWPNTEENIMFTLHNFFEESLCPRLALTDLQFNAMHWQN